MMRLVAVQRWPVVPKPPQSAAFDGEVEVGVVQHDHRILAAQFQRAVLEALGGGGANDAADCGRSGQRDGADFGMLHQRPADLRTESGDNVDHAFGHAGIGQRAHQVESGKRRVLRRLDHAGVAADDGGQQFPRRNRHGEIPRRDHAADADGSPHRHGELVGQLGRRGRPEHAAAFAGKVVAGVDGFLRVAAGFLEDLAHLAGHVAGVFFLALEQHLGGAEDDFGAARGRHQAPFGEGAAGGFDRSVHVRFRGFLEDADHVARVGGIAVFESLSGRGFHPLAVNEVLVNLGGCSAAERGRAGQCIGCHKSLLSRREECVSLYATGGVEDRASGERLPPTTEDTEDTRYTLRAKPGPVSSVVAGLCPSPPLDKARREYRIANFPGSGEPFEPAATY